MKKLLILTPRFPYPVIGGDRLRIYRLCKALSKNYELTLLSLCENEEEMSMPLPDELFTDVHRVYLPKWKSFLNALLAIPSRIPLQIAYYHSEEFKKKCKKLMPSHDASISHLIRVGDYVKYQPGCHVLEMTDAISLNYKRVKSVSGNISFKSMVYSLEQKRLECYERDILKHFEFVSLVSSIDRDFLFPEPLLHDRALLCSNGVDTNELVYSYRPINLAQKIEIVFIGNMSSLQNMDAALWFAKQVMPRLTQLGEFNFKIIGRVSEENKVKLLSHSNVIVTGTVDNISLSASSGHFAVCPMRLGAGIQNKILEYMALGLPCITSTVGFEGIGAQDRQELLIADSVDDYVEAIVTIIDNPVSTKSMTEAARLFVEKNFSWDSQLNPFVSKLDKILGRE